jgi:hypothetical protein
MCEMRGCRLVGRQATLTRDVCDRTLTSLGGPFCVQWTVARSEKSDGILSEFGPAIDFD